VEEALHNSLGMRGFVGVDLGREPVDVSSVELRYFLHCGHGFRVIFPTVVGTELVIGPPYISICAGI
jgi:hypothetical protein